MCGIVSYLTNKDAPDRLDISISINLIRESKIRGLHSFGLSYYSENNILTNKYFKIKSITTKELSKHNKFIYHNRYSTSGDYVNMDNNQPITIDNISVAMNGVISMKTKQEYEKEYNISCITENDSEIFIHLFNSNRLKELRGSYSIIWLYNNEIYLTRNNKRPLYYFIYNDSIWTVSTIDIARRSLKSLDIKNVTIHKVLPDEIYNLRELLNG